MPYRRPRPSVLVFGLALTLAVGSHLRGRASSADAIPSPEQFFGFPMGAEGQLARWDQMVDYYRLVDRQSERVLVQELGKTTNGNPYVLVIVSTPETIADLPRYQAMQRALADPRRTRETEADAIARSGKAVVLISANVHATEIATSQMMNDLVYQLAVERSAWVDDILANTIVLLIPSQNPDGQQMVVDWYREHVGTPFEESPLPELYHPYAGHDNNRDSYMLTQVETQLLTRVLYQEWLPEVYLDKHQMGNGFARIFVPPFKNPANPNVDPLVWSEVNLLGQAMAAKLHEAGKVGVIWGDLYSAFWQGANNTSPWGHNMIGLLTEVASPRLASTIVQEQVGPDGRMGASLTARMRGFGVVGRDGDVPVAAPTDVQYRMNYPRPWLGGTWSLADAVEYDRLATIGLLDAVASNRAMLKRNFYLMNQRAVEAFAHGGPYAFLVPPAQRDPSAAAKLIQLLQAQAAEVHVAEAPFVADDDRYPADTYVVLLAQPFGRWVKDMLEPQQYPDVRSHPSAPPDRPYDITAWSLGMLMGVETIQIERPFEARLRLLTGAARAPGGAVVGRGSTYVLPPERTNSLVAANRLFAGGARLAWARTPLDLEEGRSYAAGAILVTEVERPLMERLADELGLDIVATELRAGTPRLPLKAPRLAVLEPWGGNMDAGWTRWVLEQHGFEYARLRPDDLRRPALYARYDVIIVPEMSSFDIMRGLQGRHVRPEYRGGIGVEGVQHLREFIDRGGTVITLGNAAAFAVEHLGVPLVNVVRDTSPEAFYAPGSILRIAVDTRHPIGYGMPAEADAMFVNNGGYLPVRSIQPTAIIPVARYPGTRLVRSGWIIGEEKLRGTNAVIEVVSGRGRILLHTFRVQHRGQTWGTFKLLFNSIFYGPAASGLPPGEPTQDQQDQQAQQ